VITVSNREVQGVDGVRIEYSDDYGYLYFFFPTGRVIGIPRVTGLDELLQGVNSLADAVIQASEDG